MPAKPEAERSSPGRLGHRRLRILHVDVCVRGSPRPTIYLGGESEPARALAADHADVWFINGQPLDDVNQLIADVSSRPRHGAPLRFGLSAFVIARDTDEEAHAAHGRLLDLAAKDAPLRAIQKLNTDPEVVMKQTMTKSLRVGTNGGTAAGLVGSYDTVTRRIHEFHAAGIELFGVFGFFRLGVRKPLETRVHGKSHPLRIKLFGNAQGALPLPLGRGGQ
jgi:alkanesulfonate monooxygenase SsuD/methylene tetrahydromethanopterin reductase-like flavin-dependent oxidoreductase (luciferase family)